MKVPLTGWQSISELGLPGAWSDQLPQGKAVVLIVKYSGNNSGLATQRLITFLSLITNAFLNLRLLGFQTKIFVIEHLLAVD